MSHSQLLLGHKAWSGVTALLQSSSPGLQDDLKDQILWTHEPEDASSVLSLLIQFLANLTLSQVVQDKQTTYAEFSS